MKKSDSDWLEAQRKHAEYLGSLPAVDPERPKLRDRIRYSGPQLANKARRFLTLGAVYQERERFAKTRDILPTYEQWLRTFMSAADAKKEAARVHAEWAEIKARPAIEPLDE